MRYDSVRKKTQIGPTKRKKIRTVDFCDTLAAILREAKKEQMLNSIKYGPLYSQNYYRIVKEKNRTYYEVYSLPRTETPPEDYTQVSFVCLRPDGAYEALQRSVAYADTPERRSGIWMIFISIC